MKAPSAFGRLSLAALAFSPAAHAQAEAPLTFRAIREMTPVAVGRRLLGSERRAHIVKIDYIDLWDPADTLPGVLQMFLYARPMPLGVTYCSQRRFYRALVSAVSRETRPLARREPLRILAAWDEPMLARAPGCRLAPGQLFASVRDGELATRALDALADAQAAARATGPMVRFELSCVDEAPWDPDHCAGGGRETLARLPLDHACRVDAVDGDPSVAEVTLCIDWHRWLLRLPAGESGPGLLSMTWKDSEGTY